MEEGFGERYISIPHASSEEDYKDMEALIETVKDANLEEKLYIAIKPISSGRRPEHN